MHRRLLTAGLCLSILTAAAVIYATTSVEQPFPLSSAIAATSTPKQAEKRISPPHPTQLADDKQTVGVGQARARAGAPNPTSTPTAAPTPVERTEVPVVQLVPLPASDGPPPGLADVDFATGREGFAVTGEGGVFSSGDGGATWRLLHHQDGASFWAVQALDTRTALAVGHVRCSRSSFCWDPLLLRTTDGGRGKEVLHPDLGDPEAAQSWRALKIVFVSPEVGYAVRDPNTTVGPPERGIDGRLFTTRDGGQHWYPLPLPAGVLPSGGLSVLDAEHLYITSGSDVLASEDAGATWVSLHADAPLPLFAVQFLDGQHGIAAGGEYWYPDARPGRQVVLATDDGGQHWAVHFQREFPINTYVLPFTRLRFSSPSEGWVASGGCYKFGMNGPCPGPLQFTRDGGRTWTDSGLDVDRFAAVGTRAWVVRDNPRAEATGGFLALTDDAGATWRNLWHPASLVIRHSQFLDARIGWMGTNVGYFKTTDGGAHWASNPVTLPASPLSYPGAEPVFVSETTAFAFGPATASATDLDLLRSDDGGQTWRVVALPVTRTGEGGVDLRAGWVAFADPLRGWVSLPTWCAAARNCPEVLLSTTDGGTTWVRLQPGLPPQTFEDVQVQLTFGDAKHGAALGGVRSASVADGGRRPDLAGGHAAWPGQLRRRRHPMAPCRASVPIGRCGPNLDRAGVGIIPPDPRAVRQPIGWLAHAGPAGCFPGHTRWWTHVAASLATGGPGPGPGQPAGGMPRYG